MQDPNCWDFRLVVTNTTFPHNVMDAYWLSGKANVFYFSLEDQNRIVDILPNAFATPLFSKLKTLKLIGLRVNYLRAGILNEIIELEHFLLSRMNLLIIDAELLQSCPKLRYLNIGNCSQSEQVLWLENVTSSVSLNMGTCDIHGNNLRRSITEATFRGLSKIVTLYLFDNQIEFIGRKSFDIFAKTLILLDLRYNRLKTISTELFVALLANNHEKSFEICLEENPWHCDCSLKQFLNSLRNDSSIFRESFNCSTPLSLRGVPVKDAEMCALEPPDKTSIVKKCKKYDTFVTVALRKRDKVIRLLRTSNKKVQITIKDFPTDYILLWYENGKLRAGPDTMNCVLNRNANNTQNISLGDTWPLNTMHTLCMKPKHSLTMTPLNCISFYTIERADYSENKWLPNSYRFMAIVLACLVCLLLGVAIVIVIGRICPAIAHTYLLYNPKLVEQKEPSGDLTNIDQIGIPTGKCLPYDSVWKFDTQSEYIRWHIDNYTNYSIRRNSDTPPPLPPPHPDHFKKRFQATAATRTQNTGDEGHYELI